MADPTADPPAYLSGELIVVTIDDHRSKDNLFTKISMANDAPGCWWLEEDIGADYLHQMRGEHKITKIKQGRPVSEYALLHDNHALDCEKYQLIAWQVFQVASFVREKETQRQEVMVNPFTGREVGAW